MTIHSLNFTLEKLDEVKKRFDPPDISAVEKTVARLAAGKFNDAETLIRYHELLLFLRAYPHSPRIVTLTEKELASFPTRVETLRALEVDLSTMETPEVSGIAGTPVTDTFTLPIVRWLVRKQPHRVAIDWDWFNDENRLAQTWPRFMPLLDEDASVEANVPYAAWLRKAAGREKDLVWLVRRFESLHRADREKAELYDSQNLFVRWTPAFRSTRTGMRLPVRNIYYHQGPLIQRKEVSLRQELDAAPPRLQRLTAKQGEAILDLARAASTARYRELYGFTHGDPARVFKAKLGRGVDVFLTELPPAVRLPLRAYHAALFFKNGVPIGYFEGLSLFERMESGFNLYYTFRDGETAWLYARLLNIFRHLLGVTAFVIDPYQIGFENEEGIESGAFWFYRKLGFRPTRKDVMKLVLKEESKISSRPSYRTSPRTLRRLAASPMIFELNQMHTGEWDRFQVRKLGLAAQRPLAETFDGDAERMRRASVKKVSKILGMKSTGLKPAALGVVSDLIVAISLIEDLRSWQPGEKQLLKEIIKAKAGSAESRYLKLMQQHTRLREAIIKLGS